MKGRKPARLEIDPADAAELKRLANAPEAPYRIVVAAQILDARFRGERVCEIAARHRVAPSTIWRLTQAFREKRFLAFLKRRPPVSSFVTLSSDGPWANWDD